MDISEKEKRIKAMFEHLEVLSNKLMDTSEDLCIALECLEVIIHKPSPSPSEVKEDE